MARTTKAKAKKAQEPVVSMGAEIFAALKDLEAAKGIPVDYMVERIKQAIVNAYRKDREDASKEEAAENVTVSLDETGMYLNRVLTVVEDPYDPSMEVSLDAARAIEPNAQIGDTVSIPVDISKFGRIAAQTAKQVIIQGIREAERGAMYESYSSKTQELLVATVLRIDPSGDLFVQIGQGSERNTAILRTSEQIPGEVYKEGDLIRVYVVEVHRSQRGPQVAVSRTHPNVVRRLFELEVPEIADGLVAVRATEENIDPVGACVGPRGGRVAAVVNELHGEKMDIVVWSEDPCQYVAAALSPADVISVTLVPGQKACRVVVPDDQLSLAIGKEGQNARLAARLTGYKIDIKPQSQAAQEEPQAEPVEETVEETGTVEE